MMAVMTTRATYPSLKDRKIIVTGGASGIGAAMVEAFLRQGAVIGFLDIDAAAGEVLGARLSQKYPDCASPWFQQIDVTDIDALQRAIHIFSRTVGGLDVLINNAANDSRHDPLETTQDSWRKNLAINLDSAFFGSQTAIEIMTKRGGGSIINLGSINSIMGLPNMPGYIAAKSALVGLTKSLASQYGEQNIRVNIIQPGWVATDRQLESWLTKEAEQEWMKQTAIQTRIQPDDIASLALFLASDDSVMITKQSFVIDGGHV